MNGLSVSTLRQRTPRRPLSASPAAPESSHSDPRPASISRSGHIVALRPRARCCATPPGPRPLLLRRRTCAAQQPAHHPHRRRLPDHDRPQLHRLVAVRTSPAVNLEHAMQQLRPAPPLVGPDVSAVGTGPPTSRTCLRKSSKVLPSAIFAVTSKVCEELPLLQGDLGAGSER